MGSTATRRGVAGLRRERGGRDAEVGRGDEPDLTRQPAARDGRQLRGVSRLAVSRQSTVKPAVTSGNWAILVVAFLEVLRRPAGARGAVERTGDRRTPRRRAARRRRSPGMAPSVQGRPKSGSPVNMGAPTLGSRWLPAGPGGCCRWSASGVGLAGPRDVDEGLAESERAQPAVEQPVEERDRHGDVELERRAWSSMHRAGHPVELDADERQVPLGVARDAEPALRRQQRDDPRQALDPAVQGLLDGLLRFHHGADPRDVERDVGGSRSPPRLARGHACREHGAARAPAAPGESPVTVAGTGAPPASPRRAARAR